MSHVHHHAFRFYANGTEFFPHAGTRLNFVNRGIDTLTLKSLPSDTLSGGDEITVTYAHTADDEPTTVFAGTVEQITASSEGGPSNAWQDVVISSPWSKFDRLVYQQNWKNYATGQWVWSSNLVLNQDRNGSSIGFKTQLNDIFTFLKTRCGVTATAISGGQALPFDEVRDLTCAQAINRVLRWFPKKTVRLDYSGETPNLELADPSAASWTASIDKSSIVRTYNAHPITGVCLETITTGDSNGVPYRSVGNQNYPLTINPSDVDVLHASIQLAGASSSNSYESAKFRVEAPAPQSNVWWWQKHGRLKKYATVAEMTQHVSVVSYDSDMPDGCEKITSATAEELQKFGLKAGVAKFTAHVKIGNNSDDDIEEDVILQMQFTATNAVNDKTYTRAIGSSSTSGETIPANLAKAIYEDRSGELQSLTCTAVLGDTFPKVGETYEGLILQSFEVDPYELTAECQFGQPEHLSPDDMAGLMTGFRNRIRSTSCWERDSGTHVGGDDEDVPDPVDPISATEFAPGVKSKTTIKSASGQGNNDSSSSVSIDASGEAPKLVLSDGSKSINLDLADIPDEEECPSQNFGIHELKYYNKESPGNYYLHHILACSDIDLREMGKCIVDVEITPSASPGGVNKMVFKYNDGSSDEFRVMNGLNGAPDSSSGDDDPDDPDPGPVDPGDVEYLTEDDLTELTVVTGMTFAIENNKLVAKLKRKRIKAVVKENLADETVNVCDAKELDVVTGESYDTSSHQFTNTRRKITVMGDAAAMGQTPFTATPHSSES